MVKKIPNARRLSILVDDEDFERVMKYTWSISVRKNKSGSERRYAIGHVDGRTQYLHRFIMGFPVGDVDHKNHNGLDNRRKNLRVVTRSMNLANQLPRVGTSKYKGVSWEERRGKWLVHIKAAGRARHVGYFDNELDAAKAYDAAAFEQFGEYACLNLIASTHGER